MPEVAAISVLPITLTVSIASPFDFSPVIAALNCAAMSDPVTNLNPPAGDGPAVPKSASPASDPAYVTCALMFASDVVGALLVTLATCLLMRSEACLAASTAAALASFTIVAPTSPRRLLVALVVVLERLFLLLPNRRPSVVESVPVVADCAARQFCDCCQNEVLVTKPDMTKNSGL